MSTILTETSTFTATVTAPDDGDPATGASVTTGLQSLTNRSLYLNDNKGPAAAYAAFYSFDVGAVASGGTVVPITQELSFPSGAWGISSNVITVPIAGVYLVSAHAAVLSASATDNALCHMDMEVGGSAFGSIVGYRPGVDTSDNTRVSGEAIVIISNPVSSTLRFTQQGAVITFPATNYFATISIRRLGANS
jgi:hypothetical protein